MRPRLLYLAPFRVLREDAALCTCTAVFDVPYDALKAHSDVLRLRVKGG